MGLSNHGERYKRPGGQRKCGGPQRRQCRGDPPARSSSHSKTQRWGGRPESVGRGTAVWGWQQVLASAAASTSCGGKPNRPNPISVSVSLLLGTHI